MLRAAFACRVRHERKEMLRIPAGLHWMLEKDRKCKETSCGNAFLHGCRLCDKTPCDMLLHKQRVALEVTELRWQ